MSEKEFENEFYDDIFKKGAQPLEEIKSANGDEELSNISDAEENTEDVIESETDKTGNEADIPLLSNDIEAQDSSAAPLSPEVEGKIKEISDDFDIDASPESEDSLKGIEQDMVQTVSEVSDNESDGTTDENTVFLTEIEESGENTDIADDEAEYDVISANEEIQNAELQENTDIGFFDEESDIKAEDIEDEEPEDDEDEDESKKSRFVDSLFDFIELFIFSLAAVFIITTFFFRHSVVDGSSMENTLFDGEHIIISDLFYKPERGDIIVCEDYSSDLPIPIVKRVIGVAGDRVQIDTAGNVTVNGVALDESDYVYIDPNFPYYCDPIDEIVPEGEIFVMGDHRNVSSDSRKIGTIKEDSILGKVLFRFYPFDKFGAVE